MPQSTSFIQNTPYLRSSFSNVAKLRGPSEFALTTCPNLALNADGLLAEPHGGVLVDLMTEDAKGGEFPKRNTTLFMRPPAKATTSARTSAHTPHPKPKPTPTHTAVAKCNKEIQLQPRQLCDVELLMNGGFSPLTGFMDETVSFLGFPLSSHRTSQLTPSLLPLHSRRTSPSSRTWLSPPASSWASP